MTAVRKSTGATLSRETFNIFLTLIIQSNPAFLAKESFIPQLLHLYAGRKLLEQVENGHCYGTYEKRNYRKEANVVFVVKVVIAANEIEKNSGQAETRGWNVQMCEKVSCCYQEINVEGDGDGRHRRKSSRKGETIDFIDRL